MSEHQHDRSELEREEALMEAEDVAQAKFDERKADYLKEYVDEINPLCWAQTPQLYQDFDDWAVNVTDKEKDQIRDYLRLGHTQMLQFYVGGLFMEYMDEIAANAVREDMKR